jgi:DNA-3-methyladenine glycosylase
MAKNTRLRSSSKAADRTAAADKRAANEVAARRSVVPACHNERPAFDPAQLERIPRDFFNRDPRVVAHDLLGKVLLRRERRALLAGRIVETEAYLGADDPAAHSAAGRTARNAVLFGPPGLAYVYFIYGNHFCLNVSCLPDGEAGGVLIRALEPLAGVKAMARARGIDLNSSAPSRSGQPSPRNLRLIASGPGRLAEALGVTRQRDNGKDFLDSGSDLQMLDDGFRPQRIAATARIGITKAAEHPFRFIIAANPFVSGKRS